MLKLLLVKFEDATKTIYKHYISARRITTLLLEATSIQGFIQFLQGETSPLHKKDLPGWHSCKTECLYAPPALSLVWEGRGALAAAPCPFPKPGSLQFGEGGGVPGGCECRLWMCHVGAEGEWLLLLIMPSPDWSPGRAWSAGGRGAAAGWMLVFLPLPEQFLAVEICLKFVQNFHY